MRITRNENGQALLVTAMSMLVLMGFLALATDVGFLFHDRREIQTAADGAAAAGALAAMNGATDGEITTVADNAAALNGFTNSSNGVTITVNTPPTSGFHQTSPYVEVDITQSSIPTVFMSLFGVRTMSVSARAVGGPAGAAKPCLHLNYLDLRGSATIEAEGGQTGCGVYVGDNLSVTGNGNTINAGYIELAGSEGGHGSVQGTPVYPNAATEPDPFGDKITNGEPSLSSCTATVTGNTFSGTEDGGNGVVCFTGTNVDISGATLNNGVFLFENGVTAAGTGGNTTINNGTLDVYNGTFQQNSNSNLNIVAPQLASTSTQWNNGIAILVPTTNTTYTHAACKSNPNDTQELMIQFGSNNETLEGYIYAPNAVLTLHDQGGGVTATGIVADTLCDLSGSLTIPSYNDKFPSDSPLVAVALVE